MGRQGRKCLQTTVSTRTKQMKCPRRWIVRGKRPSKTTLANSNGGVVSDRCQSSQRPMAPTEPQLIVLKITLLRSRPRVSGMFPPHKMECRGSPRVISVNNPFSTRETIQPFKRFRVRHDEQSAVELRRYQCRRQRRQKHQDLYPTPIVTSTKAVTATHRRSDTPFRRSNICDESPIFIPEIVQKLSTTSIGRNPFIGTGSRECRVSTRDSLLPCCVPGSTRACASCERY